MGEGGHRGLALEACAAFRVGTERGREDLDRDGAVEARVPRLVDLAHPACPSKATIS